MPESMGVLDAICIAAPPMTSYFHSQKTGGTKALTASV